MSVKLGGIDLNSEGVSTEGNNESNLDKSPVNECHLYNPGGSGGFSVGGARVLREVNDSSITSGFVNNGLKEEMEGVDRVEGFEVKMEVNNGESEPKEGYSGSKGGVFEQETGKTDSKLDVETKGIDNNEVEDKIGTDQNEEMGDCDFPHCSDRGNQISLVVDLNSHHKDGICIQGAEGTKGFIEVNLPFSVGLAGNTDAPIKYGGFTRNQYTPIKEVLTSGQLNEPDGKDAKSGTLIPKSRGKENQTEKEGEFFVSDLVWGKVRSHPWWPGQIIEPSAASEKAMKYFKKDSYLIAYFGDQTFAWNEASKIKPFRMYFSQMKKQSNVAAFCNAMNCALDEVSRRVEFGLACRCLSEEVSAKVKSQMVVNAGIREESTKIYGGDSFSSADSFIPIKLINSLEALAKSPHYDIDILEFIIAIAQLLAFHRWKGHYQLPAVQDEKNIDEVVEDDLCSEEDNQIESGKRMSPSRRGSHMGRHFPMSNERKGKKKKYLLDLMSGSSSSFLNSGCEDIGNANSEKASVYSRKKRKAVDSVSSEYQEYPPTSEIFSKLCLAAESPMEGYNSLSSVAGFFCDFRNSICLERNNNLEKRKKPSGKQVVEKSSDLENTEAFAFEGMEDSYWTDRIIESNLDDQVLFEPETPSDKDIVAEQEGLDGTNLNLDNLHEMNHVITELLGVEDPLPLHPLDENSGDYSPTTLILNFTDLESVPSITNLNNIFNRYGPLEESHSKVLSKSKRAKVVFKRRSDAETAFSSAGKFSIFGPSLVSYRLKYTPPPREASSTSKTKRRKNATSVEDSAM